MFKVTIREGHDFDDNAQVNKLLYRAHIDWANIQLSQSSIEPIINWDLAEECPNHPECVEFLCNTYKILKFVPLGNNEATEIALNIFFRLRILICRFPPGMWAGKPYSIRTTNDAESFHATYNKEFTSPHPNLPLVVKVLNDFQLESLRKIRSARTSIKPIRREKKEKEEFIVARLKAYHDNIITRIMLLLALGFRFAGKKL